MTGTTEVASRMYEQMFDSWRKAAEQGLHMQQEMIRFWTNGLSGLPRAAMPMNLTDQLQKVQKEWTQGMSDMTRKYQEAWESHYKSGIKVLEDLFKMPEARNPDELRRRTEEFYRKSFEYMRDLSQTQVREFQSAMEKWMDVLKRPA